MSRLFQKIFLPTIFFILAYGFWVSPNFKEISAGVAIFLFGMLFLEQWFKAFTGWVLEKILQKSTGSTPKSIFFGFSAATLMQSSSLVSLLTISFLSAELISFIAALGIIFWANLWSTTGAWLIATLGMKINISTYAMPILVFWIIFAFQKTKHMKGLGSILAGLWFLFLWIHFMKEGFDSLQGNIDFSSYSIAWYPGILFFTFIGIIATVIMQSSHATIILVITALATWQVNYINALAIVIWANIGTTITAVIGSFTSNLAGKRLALSDVIFKVGTGLIFIIFLPIIIHWIGIISLFIWIAAENYILKLALFHSLFNLVWLIIVIPLRKYLIHFVGKVLPEKKSQTTHALYLNESSLDFPDTAIYSLIKESRHMYEKISQTIFYACGIEEKDFSPTLSLEDFAAKLKFTTQEEIADIYEKDIKPLYGEIVRFATLAELNNNEKYADIFYKIKLVNRSLIKMLKAFKHSSKNYYKYSKDIQESWDMMYMNMLKDILVFLSEINALDYNESSLNKILLLWKIEYGQHIHDTIKHSQLNILIKEQKINNYQATSYINDIYYKNELIQHLLFSMNFLINENISENMDHIKTKKKIEKWFQNTQLIEWAGILKYVWKLQKKRANLLERLKSCEKWSEKYKTIEFSVKSIEFLIAKHQQNII